ncbi:Apolipoprotein N-acyltransferase [Corynebacterium felinum]|uniref:Apolipoprotein N-acyltransferase n=1 Tax=Corynebacterium felinum TaxID=131318 RepID=A0ABU2BAK5_9CORY|nr:apolipoprotein N-acyltransferase [Corynebacterium felinum]WJY94980.1 Apolipoprotein N-acyltransferase [Corynebacterium felinum]
MTTLNTPTEIPSLIPAALRVGIALLSGVFVYASYQPLGWWQIGIIGIGLFIIALSRWGSHNISARFGALIGFTHSATVYLLLLPWVGEYVGAMPYIALALFISCWSLILGTIGAKILPHRWGMWVFALLYVVVEWARSTVPFGGFAWVRLAWGQVSGPLARITSIGGPALVTFITVLLAATIVALLWRRRQAPTFIALSLIAGLLISAHIAPRANSIGTVTVAAIQGNVPRLGLDFNAQRRAVLANHVRETEKLDQPVDLVIWPENSSDVNPFTDPQASGLINEAVGAVDAPILVGTITSDEVGARNTMQVFDPTTGPGDYHHKKYLQPFGEYMPFRSFFRLFSEYVDLAGNFKPGTGTGTVTMHAAQRDIDVTVGIATCYEVAFDAAARDAVLNGATLLTTPTNNATFGFTDMTYQQLAMSQMRAIELDRAVVVAATSGVSALVSPDGTVTQHTEIFHAATLVEDLPLKNSITLAARFGSYIEWALVIIGLIACALCLRTSPQPARGRSPQRAQSGRKEARTSATRAQAYKK